MKFDIGPQNLKNAGKTAIFSPSLINPFRSIFTPTLFSVFVKKEVRNDKKNKNKTYLKDSCLSRFLFFFFSSVAGTGCYGNGNNVISLQYSLLFLSIFPFIHFFSSRNTHNEKRFIFLRVSLILSRWMCECHLVWRRPYHWKSMKNIVVKKSVQKFENKFFNGCPSYHSRDWMSRKLRNN